MQVFVNHLFRDGLVVDVRRAFFIYMLFLRVIIVKYLKEIIASKTAKKPRTRLFNTFSLTSLKEIAIYTVKKVS